MIDWVAMLAAVGVSANLIVRSVHPILEANAPALARVVCLGIVGALFGCGSPVRAKCLPSLCGHA
jgi:hypothetical protein